MSEMIEQLRLECDRLRDLAHSAPMNQVHTSHDQKHKWLGTHWTGWADASRAWMRAKAKLDAALQPATDSEARP
jgi:hypothetical protein